MSLKKHTMACNSDTKPQSHNFMLMQYMNSTGDNHKKRLSTDLLSMPKIGADQNQDRQGRTGS